MDKEIQISVSNTYEITKGTSHVTSLRWLRRDEHSAPKLQFATGESFEQYTLGVLVAAGVRVKWHDIELVTSDSVSVSETV